MAKTGVVQMYDEKEEVSEDDKFYQRKSQINIALQSQLRIQTILDKFVQIDLSTPFDSAQKQKLKLDNLINFIQSATPYLSPTDVKKYGKEILSLKISKKSTIRKGVNSLEYQFDPKLNKRINEIIIELQNKLRGLYTRYKDDDDDGL